MAELEYEKRDVTPRTVAKAALGLAGLAALSAAVSFGVFVLLANREKKADRPVPPLAQQEPGRLPPEPRLQRAPQVDFAQVQQEDRHRLSTYGWVDQQAGTVRIPIEEAIKLYAQRTAGRSLAPMAAPAVAPAPPAAAPSAGTAPGASPSPPPRSHP